MKVSLHPAQAAVRPRFSGRNRFTFTESTGTSWPTPSHDATGNADQIPRPLSLGNSFDLKYDAWTRLAEVKNTGGSVVATYAYDGANRRVTNDDGTDTRHYYYSDQWQVVEERLNAGTSADRWYVWGMRYRDDLILRDDGTDRLYALHDYFSVTAVVDTSGNVQERYGYDGFGAPRYMTPGFAGRGSSNYNWETLYAAYRYDLESGLYQVRNRYLHPNLGRWVTRDPIGEREGPNLYAYVKNESVNQVDFLGLQAWQVAGGAGSGAGGGQTVNSGGLVSGGGGVTIPDPIFPSLTIPPAICSNCQRNAPPGPFTYNPDTGEWEQRGMTSEECCIAKGGRWVTNAELLGKTIDDCALWFANVAWTFGDYNPVPPGATQIGVGVGVGIAGCIYACAGPIGAGIIAAPYVAGAFWCAERTCTF